MVIDAIFSLSCCVKYAQHLIRNLKDIRTGWHSYLKHTHCTTLKLEVFFIGLCELIYQTAVRSDGRRDSTKRIKQIRESSITSSRL